MSSTIVILSFLAHLILFLLFYVLPLKFFSQQQWFQKAGKKLLATKEHQLKTNSLLKRFSQAVESGHIWTARLIIASLIFAKSVGMAFIGIVGMSLIMVPIQAIMMQAIIQQTKRQGISEQSLLRLTGFQLTAMVSSTAIGNLVGWRIFIDQLTFVSALDHELLTIAFTSLLVLFFCWAASLVEVNFYKVNKTLIG